MKEARVFEMSDLISDIAEAGKQVTQIGAAEGSAGNISVFARQIAGIDPRFTLVSAIDLPVEVAALAGGWVLITGTGLRLRDVGRRPEKSLCLLKIDSDGKRAELYSGANLYPTSELNSHIAVLNDQVKSRDLDFSVVLHAQPFYVTFLSHIDRYCDDQNFNQHLLRWEPETLATFPEGIGMLPYQLPGSAGLMEATVAAMKTHKFIVWQRHGIVSRSDASAVKAADYVEYIETAARYELTNLQMSEPSNGLSAASLREIASRFNLNQKFF